MKSKVCAKYLVQTLAGVEWIFGRLLLHVAILFFGLVGVICLAWYIGHYAEHLLVWEELERIAVFFGITFLAYVVTVAIFFVGKKIQEDALCAMEYARKYPDYVPL